MNCLARVGMSYSPAIPRESLTVEQYISDTIAVTNYLRQRFGKEKIYLMGHSGGTFFGIQAAGRALIRGVARLRPASASCGGR